MWNMKLWWKLFIVEQTKVFLFVCKNDALVFRLGTGMLNFMAKRFRDSLSFTVAAHLRAAQIGALKCAAMLIGNSNAW